MLYEVCANCQQLPSPTPGDLERDLSSPLMGTCQKARDFKVQEVTLSTRSVTANLLPLHMNEDCLGGLQAWVKMQPLRPAGEITTEDNFCQDGGDLACICLSR